MKSNTNYLIFLIVLFFSLFLFLGCPGAKRDELEFYRGKVDSLRTLVNNFLIDYNKMKYQSYLENQPFFVSELYHKYGNLFNTDDINLINNLLKLEQRPERIDRLERLKVFIYEKIVEKETAGILDRIELIKHYINYPSRDGLLRYDDLDEILSQENNQRKRSFLYNSNARFFEDLQKMNFKLFNERKTIIIDSLKFGSFNQFASMVRQEDLSKFYQVINGFISSTNEFYYQQLYEFLRSKNYQQNQFYAYDIPFLINDQKLNKYFKKDSLVRIFLETMYNLGFKVDSLQNLKIIYSQEKQMNRRETKRLKTTGFTISIPNENHLFIKSAGGYSNYERTFSELARLLPSIFSNETYFEMNYFGDNSIPLTYKYLFSNLLDEYVFINNIFFHSNRLSAEFLKLRSFKKLYTVRKICADFIVEYLMIDSSKTDIDSLTQIYNSILGYTITNGDKFRLFFTLNDYYEEIDYLKAYFLESMMKTKIREKYGQDWFLNQNLKNYLIKFLQRGKALNKDNFLMEIGYYYLDPRFFFNDIISLTEKSKEIRQK